MQTRLQYQHETIIELIEGFTEEQLKRRVDPDKWSIFENIAHLAAYQLNFIKRLERIRKEPAPVFERYVAENDPLFPGFLERSLEGLLTEIAMDRRSRIIPVLESREEKDLLRTALHPKHGPLTMIQWTEFFLLHEAHHLFTIFKLAPDLRRALHQ